MAEGDAGGVLSGKLKAGPSRGQPPKVAVPLRTGISERPVLATKAGARLPVSRTRRRRALRPMLIGSVVAHLLFLALLIVVPRQNEETPPAESGIAMEFEQPKPQGAPSDQPQAFAGEGTKAPVASPQQSAPPAPPMPLLTPSGSQPPPLSGAMPPDTTALQAPPETPPPDASIETPSAPESVPIPDNLTPATPIPPTPPAAFSGALPAPAGQRSVAPTPDTPVVASVPPAESPSDVQVSPGPLAELFNFAPTTTPQVTSPPASPPRTPASHPKPSRLPSAFPTPRDWAFTPATRFGGSVAQGAPSRGLNLSFAPQLHGGGGSKSSPDFSAPDAGPDWENELHAWWDRHGYFPRQAAEAGEQGTVGLHLIVGHDGHVTSARLTTASGSVFLDQGALGLFRDANLPALPPQTDKPQIPVDLRIHYVLH